MISFSFFAVSICILLGVGVHDRMVMVSGRIPDRDRVVKMRHENSPMAAHINSRVLDQRTQQRTTVDGDGDGGHKHKFAQENKVTRDTDTIDVGSASGLPLPQSFISFTDDEQEQLFHNRDRDLGSQLTGCCSSYSAYSSSSLCKIYGQDCKSGEYGSNDSDDDSSCLTDGLSFIGVSFSVNTAQGNPYSYQLCDQFPMENIIDRDYNYIMSMDEDGWLVGGGYKAFDYSGKMP
jgi:hypothetical protein